VSPATEHLEVIFPDTLAPNASVTGHVRVSPASVDKNFEETLTFQFDSRGVDPARFSIPVRQRLLGSAGASSSR